MEKYDFVDQRAKEINEFITVNAVHLAIQGSIVAAYRMRNGHRLGPYFRLACRDGDGRQISVYLGTERPITAEIRERLRELQEPMQSRRYWNSVRRAVRQELKKARQQLHKELAKQGLMSKGAEIRGWRKKG